jgi:hypothetical protein
MSLDVASKLGFAVFCVIKLHASDDHPSADGLRDSAGWGEAIQPEGTVVDYFDDHTSWHLVEGEYVVNTAGPFFCTWNVLFDFRYVLIIQMVLRVMAKSASSARRGSNCPSMSMWSSLKPRFMHVHALDLFDCGQDGLAFLILTGTKAYVAGY